jgi:hypothetical protein
MSKGAAMTKYRVENYNTSAVMIVESASRKDAHETGQRTWPGEGVMVQSVREYDDYLVYQEQHNQIMDLLEGVNGYLPDSEYDKAVLLLRNAAERIHALIGYFKERGFGL